MICLSDFVVSICCGDAATATITEKCNAQIHILLEIGVKLEISEPTDKTLQCDVHVFRIDFLRPFFFAVQMH